jgi:hypothetical protein
MTRIALLALVAGVLAVPSTAVADGWFSKMGMKSKETTLGEILRHPHAFVDVRVEFKVYFNQPGESYNPYYTRFTEELYGNFTAWPIDARLYDKRDYQRTYQFFFMPRQNKKWKKLQGLERMTVIEVTGYVREVFRGQPWIEIEKFRTTGGGLRQKDVRNVINGDAYYAAGKYDQAKRYYKKAISRRLPDLVRADLYRRLADAYYHQGKYRDALNNYYNALDKAPRSLVLKQGVAAAKAAVARAKAERKGARTTTSGRSSSSWRIRPRSRPRSHNGTSSSRSAPRSCARRRAPRRSPTRRPPRSRTGATSKSRSSRKRPPRKRRSTRAGPRRLPKRTPPMSPSPATRRLPRSATTRRSKSGARPTRRSKRPSRSTSRSARSCRTIPGSSWSPVR